MKVFLALVLSAIIGINATPVYDLTSHWEAFKLTHGKQYTSSEETVRMAIFNDNLAKILNHNEKFAQGLVSYNLTVNKFTDVTPEELKKYYTGYKRSNKPDSSTAVKYKYQAAADIPNSIDWRSKGAVTGVKDQLQCGSCWAFSATGALEGQLFIKTGRLVSISEQNIMDCATERYESDGCNGGWMEQAFQYVIDNRGIDSESYYPYQGVNGACQYNVAGNVTAANSYTTFQIGDESGVKESVATHGPVAISIDVLDDLFSYESGVYYNPSCSSTDVDHGVLIVGYGKQDGQDYWLIKNSWGLDWGEKGYLKLARNKNNHCGVTSLASVPNL